MTDSDNRAQYAQTADNQPEMLLAEGLTGYEFSDKNLLWSALMHSSAAPLPSQSYERLEFFGDRILALVLSDWLYRAFPDADQGELTTRFHALARKEYLASICTKLGLQQCLIHEKGAANLSERASVQADMIEALIAAIYLDGGLEAAAAFIKAHWQVSEAAPDNVSENPKSALQEWAAAQKLGLPSYKLVGQSGSDHEPNFCIEVSLKGFSPQTGLGRSRKIAEREAAAAFLKTHIRQDKAEMNDR